MSTSWKVVLPAAALCGAVAGSASGAQPKAGDPAPEFPARPVRIVVPSTPGGGSDVLTRLIAPRLTEAWRQQIVVDNRAGAAGIIGSEIVARATPDGHTILIVATGYAVNLFLYKKLPYDTVKDFAPITVVATTTHVLVAHPSLPAATVKDLLALAKSKPGSLTYAHSGVGTGGHLSVELFKKMAGVNMVGVPYKGAGASTAAVLSGEVQMLFTQVAPALPHVRAGRLRALATTSLARSPQMPDVPTLHERGLAGYQVDAWAGMLAPAKTPPRVISKLQGGIARALHSPDVKSRLESLGFEPGGNTPQQFAAFIKSEMDKWSRLIREAGIKAEQTY